ncbi:MAG: hypothetical protein LBQ71_14540 [Hungatella sp.]|jgi:hypothetical protein|nr:hypothetical protein [Hungatella sp.]
MKKMVIDLAVACVCLAIISTAILYPNQVRGRYSILLTAGLLGIVFLFLAIRDKEERQEIMGRMEMDLPSEK